jgi:hypothetical protein
MTDCERRGSSFRVELCAVHEDDERGRIEAWLCYDCRTETTNERLGYAADFSPEAGDSVNE